MVYEGSGGNVLLEYKGGPIADQDEMFEVFGSGTERRVVPAGDNQINGVTQFETGATSGNSVGLTTPQIWRGMTTQYGLDREAAGTLVAKLRMGMPAFGTRRFLFGAVADDTVTDRTVQTSLTVASDVLTAVEDNFAGFYYDAYLTSKPQQWRCVALNSGGGVKKLAEAPVLVSNPVEAAAQYMGVRPDLSPTLSVEISYDGTVEFYHNGNIVRRVEKGVDPKQLYRVLFVMETGAASRAAVGVDYFCAEFARYYGPVVP